MSLGRVVVVLCIFGAASACFITNCPPGGKRSGGNQRIGATKKCTSCGPGGMGRCYGENICCGREIGCYIGTRESGVCRTENLSPVLCENPGKSCQDGSGQCAADAICCSEEKCQQDEACRMNPASLKHHRRPEEDPRLPYLLAKVLDYEDDYLSRK